jgi:prepilin-type N-terminal cleavage/methylation domain-containing protein
MNISNDGRTLGRIRLWPTKAGAGAFSVMELIITMAIIAIVAGIAYPSFNKMAVNGNLRTAARDIMSDIASLKERAMAENTAFEIPFDKDNNKYILRKNSIPPVDESEKSPASFGPGIQLTEAPFGAGTTVSFLTRGTLSQAGHIKLVNSRGSSAIIRCNLSGRTYVQFTMQ